MKKFLAMLGVVNLSMAALAGETPMMVSFKDSEVDRAPREAGDAVRRALGRPQDGGVYTDP
jgi:hypothetical protein